MAKRTRKEIYKTIVPSPELYNAIEENRQPAGFSPYVCDVLERWFAIGRHKGNKPLKD